MAFCSSSGSLSNSAPIAPEWIRSMYFTASSLGLKSVSASTTNGKPRIRQTGLNYVRRADHVVQRAVRVVPQGPQIVEEIRDQRDDRADDPQREVLDHHLAQRGVAKVERHAVVPDHA